MKAYIVATILFFSAAGALSAAEATDLGDGFAYAPVGAGKCKVLIDGKNGRPIYETSKRTPSKVVLVGSKSECPTEYNGYKVSRLATGNVDSFIYAGIMDSGRRLHIYRKFGSNFTFKYGPNPKK